MGVGSVFTKPLTQLLISDIANTVTDDVIISLKGILEVLGRGGAEVVYLAITVRLLITVPSLRLRYVQPGFRILSYDPNTRIRWLVTERVRESQQVCWCCNMCYKMFRFEFTKE